MQFFGNSSGDHTVETLNALTEIGHSEALHALDGAMKLVGLRSRESNRDKRLRGIEKRYDELQGLFSPFERAFYDSKGTFRQKLMKYAIDHATEFRN